MSVSHPLRAAGSPRLEVSLEGPYSNVGPVPFYSPRGAPRPEQVEGPPTRLVALRNRLEAARANSLAAFQRPPIVHFLPNDKLVAINADLDAIRNLNAPLPHHYRSRTVETWPDPVFRPTVLHSWRDVCDALGTALLVLGVVERYKPTWNLADD